MCQTDLEPKNVGLCLCVPLAQKYQKLSLESLRVLGFQDTIKRFSSDLPVLWCIFMWEDIWTMPKLHRSSQVINDVLTLFMVHFTSLILAKFTNLHPAICQELCTREIWPLLPHVGILSRSASPAEARLPYRVIGYSLRTGKPIGFHRIHRLNMVKSSWHEAISHSCGKIIGGYMSIFFPFILELVGHILVLWWPCLKLMLPKFQKIPLNFKVVTWYIYIFIYLFVYLFIFIRSLIKQTSNCP